MNPLVIIAGYAALMSAGVYAGHKAELRVREAQAWACVKASDQTDTAVEACFSDRELPQPEGEPVRVRVIETEHGLVIVKE